MIPVPFAGLPRPLLFAHRGASRVAPENTLEAFELAYRLGAQVLEMDVHATADGEVVVLHDATLQRTTDGTGAVADRPYRDVAKLDAGCRFVAPGGGRPFARRGVVVPRLADVFQSFPQAAFNIEIKVANPRLVQAVLQLLTAVDPRRVVLTAASAQTMQLIEQQRPAMSLGMSRRQVQDFLRIAYMGRDLLHFAGRCLQIPPFYRGLPVCTGRVRRAAQLAQAPIHLWTINQPKTAGMWLTRGIDGLMSDDPGALTDIFAQFHAAGAARAAG